MNWLREREKLSWKDLGWDTLTNRPIKGQLKLLLGSDWLLLEASQFLGTTFQPFPRIPAVIYGRIAGRGRDGACVGRPSSARIYLIGVYLPVSSRVVENVATTSLISMSKFPTSRWHRPHPTFILLLLFHLKNYWRIQRIFDSNRWNDRAIE